MQYLHDKLDIISSIFCNYYYEMLLIFPVGKNKTNKKNPKCFLLLNWSKVLNTFHEDVLSCVCVQDKKGHELPNVVELEIANMEKLVHQQREPEKKPSLTTSIPLHQQHL